MIIKIHSSSLCIDKNSYNVEYFEHAIAAVSQGSLYMFESDNSIEIIGTKEELFDLLYYVSATFDIELV